jgi:hypothetical protein
VEDLTADAVVAVVAVVVLAAGREGTGAIAAAPGSEFVVLPL